MKVRIDYLCLPRIKRADYDAEDIFIEVDLPFVPAVGMLLKVTPKGEFYKVSDVMYDLCAPHEGLCIGFEYPGAEDGRLRPWPEMKAEGWRIS